MAKASVYIMIAFVSMNAFAGMLINTGVAADLGVDPSTGNQQELKQAQSQANQFTATQGGSGTLFGLITAGMGLLEGLFNAIVPAGAMLIRAGVPSFFVAFSFVGAPIYATLDLLSYARGGADLL